MSRLRSFLPKCVMRSIYFSIFHSHLSFQILAWGSEAACLYPLQKKAIRIINNEHYLHHTDPLFKHSKILKVHDIYKLSILKFYHRYSSKSLPYYLQSIPFLPNSSFHEYSTRHACELRPSRPRTEYSRTTVRHSVTSVINNLPAHVLSFISQDIDKLVIEYKHCTILSYLDYCSEKNCFACAIIHNH